MACFLNVNIEVNSIQTWVAHPFPMFMIMIKELRIVMKLYRTLNVISLGVLCHQKITGVKIHCAYIQKKLRWANTLSRDTYYIHSSRE